MNRTVVSLLLFGVCSVTCTSSVEAAPINTLVPTQNEVNNLPKFGFSGELVPGVGDRVKALAPGGRFEQLGIEVGDILLSVNGFPLTEAGGWHSALIRARSQGVTTLHLQIRDKRTGTVRFRDISVSFNTGSGGQSNAVKAQLAVLQNRLRALQVQALSLQNIPQPFRDKALKDNVNQRAQIQNEINRLKNL